MNATQEKGNKMEGWLLLIKSNQFSMHNISTRYFVLEDFHLKSFNSIPSSNNELPTGNAVVDSCIRVIDNGSKNIHNKPFFIFTLYHTSNHKEQLKLGAKSPDEAAGWIHTLKITTSKKQCPYKGKNIAHFLDSKWKSSKLDFPRRTQSCSSLGCLAYPSSHLDMLERVAALRELYGEKSGSSCTYSCGERIRSIQEPEKMVDSEKNQIRNEAERWSFATRASLSNLDDVSDIFFDVLEPATLQNFEREWTSKSSELDNESLQPRILQDSLAQKKGERIEEGVPIGDMSCKYGSTLPMDSSYKSPCSCAEADPSSFTIRGENYLRNKQKVKAKETMMQLVGADWLKSDKREEDLARRSGGIVQKHAAHGGSEFFIVINMQVPGPTTYNLALYYMTRAPLEENKLLERFVNGDDAFRNSRFKLTPYISKGSWIVKQSVKRKPCLLCKALEVKYFQGKNYLEMDVDIGSSKVARSVANLVLGYVNSLVIELAFLIQANTEEELPECLLGTCRLNHLDVAKADSLRA